LGGRWSSWLKVPGFVEHCVVARFDNAGFQVKVDDVLVRSRVTKKDAGEIVTIEFASARSCAFYADSRAKCFEVCYVWLTTIPTFIGSFVCSRVDKTIMEINGVEEGNRPELSGEPSTI
jgi:hypothetical protein